MSNQYAIRDGNRVPGLLAHSGTANTAELIRVVVNPNGAFIMDIVETTGFNGGTVAIGTAAVEMTFTGITQSIMITADIGNSDVVYIGGAAVANDGANAVTYLNADQSVTFDLNDGAAPLYAVGGTTGLKVYKIGLT